MRVFATQLSASYAEKYPALARRRQGHLSPRGRDFSRVLLGHDPRGRPVCLGETERLEHMATIGTTGSGKTTHFTSLAKQDARRGRGGLIMDPHGGHDGSLYAELVAELANDGFFETRRVHLIDPNIRSHVVPINPLAQLQDTDISVIADALVTAFERVWDDENTHEKPTIRTLLKATFIALSELHMPLANAKLLFDPHDDGGLRGRVIARLTNEYARDELQRLHQTALDERSKRDFRAQVLGPINRINEFVSSDALRAMFSVVDEPGAKRQTLDLLDVMNRGDIVIVNLQHGEAFSEADADLLGAILLRYLFLLAPRRTNREPFFVHIDEAHRFMVGDDLPGLFAEARKFGIAMHVGLQYLAQAGPRDGLLRQALLNCTEIKCVMRVKSPAEAQELAEFVIPLSLERPVAASVRPTVVGQRRVRLPTYAAATHEAEAAGEARTDGEMEAVTHGTASATTTSTGTASGTSELSSELLTPPLQIFGPNAPNAAVIPTVLSQTSGTGLSQMETSSTAHSEVESVSHTYARSRARTTSRSRSSGRSESDGWHEGHESVFRDLPTSYHSKESELYFAGEMIRALPVGRAFVNWRGVTHLVTIPPPKRRS